MRTALYQRRLQNGTTYNAYLIFGEKTALVDASHEKFRGLFMRALREQLSKAGRTLDYVIVSHTEPDHSGASSVLASVVMAADRLQSLALRHSRHV